MTLFKQIALLVTLLFLLLAGVYIASDFKRTGNFLQGQMQTTAQDMATTLGIVISNLPDGDDQATLEVLFNSVFDSGYYSKIELLAVDGSTLHQKSQQIQISGVPEWFLNWVSLKPAQGSTRVMKGWTQLGELKLSLHPGYAYSGLYASLVSTVNWFVAIFLLSIIVLWLLLHYLLRPLQRVKEQADSIQNNIFVQQERLPATIELKRVVEAMNRMVSKVKAVFDEQEKTLSQYHELLYQDKYSGLGNRRYMLDHLQRSLAEESSFHGCLGIIKLVNFDWVRDQHGYEVTDKVVKTMADLVSQSHYGASADRTARLSDDEFAFLIAADEDSVIRFITHLFESFQEKTEFESIQDEFYLVAGVAHLEVGLGLGDLLASVDYCLTQAISEGPYNIEKKVSSTLALPQGKMQWRHWLDQVLYNDQLFLVGQLALNHEKQAVQKELFVRCRNQQGQVVPASAFMPMAASLGLAIDIDKAVFRLIHENAQLNRSIPLALNLSAAFFELADAQAEFEQMLEECRDQGVQLCIEASHHVLKHHPEMRNKIAGKVKQFGHQFGIDNLDLTQTLQLLQSTGFDYVKINAITLSELTRDERFSGFQALKTITETLDIRIIVVGVDSQEQFEQFRSLGIEIMQGNLLGEPETL